MFSLSSSRLASFRASLLISSFLLPLAFAGCFGSGTSTTALEKYIPADVFATVSFSTEDTAQMKHLQAIDEKLGDDQNFSDSLSDSFDEQLGASSLSFSEDIAPALGDRYRMVLAMQGSGGQSGDQEAFAYAAVTLEDANKLEAAFDRFVEEGELEQTKLNKLDTYSSAEDNFFSTIQGDVLLIANTAEGLVDMSRQKEADSLWAVDEFQSAMKQAGSGNLVHVMTFPQKAADAEDAQSFSVSQIPAVLESQSLTLRATAEGFNVDVYVQADRELAREAGVSFDDIPHEKAYLLKEVPSEGLMAYFESYGLQQTLEQAEALGDDTGALDQLNQATTSFLSADLQDELLAFMDKGYVVSVHHEGEGVIPGLSFFVDASSDVEAARTVMAQLDGQITAFQVLLESALPGAIRKGTTTIQGSSLNQLEVDLSRLDEAGLGQTELSAVLGNGTLTLTYGVLGDRLLISLADVWVDDFVSIADSELYRNLSSSLGRANEGLILIDAAGVASFADELSVLRDSFSLDSQDGPFEFAELLEAFEGGIAASESSTYSTHFQGILKLK